jgi:acetyl esterase/lipase
VDDVKSAIVWARQHAGYYGSFNGNVAAFGTSSGGNQVLMAAATGNQYSTPDAVVGASGFPELGVMSTNETVCGESYAPTRCWQGNEAYMGFELDTGDWCLEPEGDPDNWSGAGPVCQVDGSEPPIYIVNGTDEASTFQAAVDLEERLDGLSVDVTFCQVSQSSGHLHGTELFGQTVHCDGSSAVVDLVFAWLVDRVG